MEKQWLRNFPVSLFVSVMGITGLSIAYQNYAHFFPLAQNIGMVLLTIAFLLFFSLLIVYISKILTHKHAVLAEFNHPVTANFFPVISISLLLLAIGSFDINQIFSRALWLVGSSLHLMLSLILMSRWITQKYDITNANPTWFIPIVGNILVPIVGVEFFDKEISWFFFSIGLFFWLVMFQIVFYRLVFHDQLVKKLVPTLAILMAPPAVGFCSYVKLTGSFDMFARIMLYLALFLVLLLLSLARQFFQLRFVVSWWAYTFPLCAVTIAFTIAANFLPSFFMVWVSTGLLVLSSVVVALVATKTVGAIFSKQLYEE